MNKILLIIQREYLTRVKKKSFIVMTFLVPGLFIAMYGIIFFLLINHEDFTNVKKVEVVDETGHFANRLKSSKTVKFHAATDFEAAKRELKNGDDNYVLRIPAKDSDVVLLSRKKPSLETSEMIEDQLNGLDRTDRLVAAGIDTSVVNKKDAISVTGKQLTDEGEKEGGAIVALIIGMVGAVLIYMSLFIYGVQVMRGVIEEKVNRIIEVVISSVKPFQLMMGKTVGVALVGLTQFTLWVVFVATITTGAVTLFAKKGDIEKVRTTQTTGVTAASQNQVAGQSQAKMEKAMTALKSVNWVATLGTFFFYFLFGFLLYSSVFAAVGSAVDSETDAQQFMLPVTMPLIFTFILSINFVVANPDSPISFWLSIIPFTSPIAMMIRMPYGVPAWELALSMFLLVGGFVFITWVAARIYRVGILMYGKKTTYKELAKWFRYKE